MQQKNARVIVFEKPFADAIPEGENRFFNLYAAWVWCKENGYSYASTCGNQPIGLMVGDFDWIAKWKNLTPNEKAELDGIISFPFTDTLSCMVVIYKASHALELCINKAKSITEPRTERRNDA